MMILIVPRHGLQLGPGTSYPSDVVCSSDISTVVNNDSCVSWLLLGWAAFSWAVLVWLLLLLALLIWSGLAWLFLRAGHS